jgi:FSR family fosmidomycin resistance protein-like MFS transporter
MDRRAVIMLTAGHMITDLPQGAMPALLPFFVTEHNLSYAQAAGLVFAATVASSVVQPIFGTYADRTRAAWLMPAGVLLAGTGLALTGVAGQYWLMAAVLIVSGLGVAAFHPEAARAMNAAAGARKATGFSFFSMGGNAGFAVGPILGSSLAVALGLRGALLLAVPAAIMAATLALNLGRMPSPAGMAARSARPAPATDRQAWRDFGRLSAAIICRSIVFYGMNTFVPLYWIDVLGQPPASGGSVLSLQLFFGLQGTLAGGRLADRFGARRFAIWVSLALAPMLVLFVATRSPLAAMLVLAGVGSLVAAPTAGLLVYGQGLLPNHIGVVSGVVIGLSVSVGGALTPLMGWLGDHYGLQLPITGLALFPLLAALLVWTLPRDRARR